MPGRSPARGTSVLSDGLGHSDRLQHSLPWMPRMANGKGARKPLATWQRKNRESAEKVIFISRARRFGFKEKHNLRREIWYPRFGGSSDQVQRQGDCRIAPELPRDLVVFVQKKLKAQIVVVPMDLVRRGRQVLGRLPFI